MLVRVTAVFHGSPRWAIDKSGRLYCAEPAFSGECDVWVDSGDLPPGVEVNYLDEDGTTVLPPEKYKRTVVAYFVLGDGVVSTQTIRLLGCWYYTPGVLQVDRVEINA